MNERELVEVYRAKDGPQAHLLRSALEAEGIRAVVVGDILQGALGAVPPGWQAGPQVMVESHDEARARQIAAQLEATDIANDAELPQADDSIACLACGARMGPQDETCPACGWSHREGVGNGE